MYGRYKNDVRETEVTEQELVQKLKSEGYSDREISLAKKCYYIGRMAILLESSRKAEYEIR